MKDTVLNWGNKQHNIGFATSKKDSPVKYYFLVFRYMI